MSTCPECERLKKELFEKEEKIKKMREANEKLLKAYDTASKCCRESHHKGSGK